MPVLLWNAVPGTTCRRCPAPATGEPRSARSGFQRLAQRVGLIGRHLHDEPAPTLERDPHDDAAALLGDLERTVACPRLHGRHVVSPHTLWCSAREHAGRTRKLLIPRPAARQRATGTL